MNRVLIAQGVNGVTSLQQVLGRAARLVRQIVTENSRQKRRSGGRLSSLKTQFLLWLAALILIKF